MRLKISLLMFLLVCYCFSGHHPARAAETNGDTAGSAVALSQWLTNHQTTGGTLRLTADIEWDGYLSIQPEAPVTIDAGAHCIHLNSLSYLALYGPVTVQGTPLPGSALFDTEARAQLSLGDGAAVEARGDHTVAVRTRWEEGLVAYSCTIRAVGTDAAAIQSAGGNLSLCYAHVIAQGENAICVDSGQDSADIFFSILEAEGPGAVSLRSGAVSTVDSSKCQPVPKNAVVTSASSHEISLALGRSTELFHKSILDEELVPQRVTLIFGETDTTQARELSLDWSPDTTLPPVPGKYQVTGALNVPEDFGQLLGDFVPTVDIQLVDPSKPYLMPMFKFADDNTYAIPYFVTLNAQNHREKLYISDDMGDSWRYVPSGTDLASSFICYDHMTLQFRDYFMPDKTYLIKMVVESPEISGVSNILKLTLSSNGDYEISGFEGDRDFSDREDDTVSSTPGPPDKEFEVRADALGDSTAYNQNQLQDLVAANPDSTTFFGNGIQASISSQALIQLLPEESDVLTVRCTLLGGSSYHIELIKNGAESIDFSKTPLRVRVNCQLREGETLDHLSFKTEDGISASIVSYDKAAGQLELLVTTPGIYTLSSTWAAPASALAEPNPAPPVSAWWIVPVLLLIVAIAGLAVFRRKKGMV